MHSGSPAWESVAVIMSHCEEGHGRNGGRERSIPRLWAPAEPQQSRGSGHVEEAGLPAAVWPLRDPSSFQKLNFINQASRSYLSLLSWLLLGHSPIVYLEGISSVTQS